MQPKFLKGGSGVVDTQLELHIPSDLIVESYYY